MKKRTADAALLCNVDEIKCDTPGNHERPEGPGDLDCNVNAIMRDLLVAKKKHTGVDHLRSPKKAIYFIYLKARDVSCSNLQNDNDNEFT